ncbi:hypothetical protein H8356DRAFT_1082389 [Neocallimastix lanati (nom. inval.)]|uniref:Uncharacterized protein n=1 Tax=Neocallimastix californiae TaxID=1754190 RepID=A0A1Y2EWG9_9FUNG|nr:hypothetical protein H8356DRAFT_1082389 [Neocallimastix sp. JGI-2020a]ORY75604.1 hypothetical protein LY90DRAFT_502149 [Neocallimastix californiae]|eukprot:ORY75604.1 hypothetical protein LY90DRAFT_502149 [Neocallimastix californiae]
MPTVINFISQYLNVFLLDHYYISIYDLIKEIPILNESILEKFIEIISILPAAHLNLINNYMKDKNDVDENTNDPILNERNNIGPFDFPKNLINNSNNDLMKK